MQTQLVGCAPALQLTLCDDVLLVVMHAGKAWEDSEPWNRRLFALDELSDLEKGRLNTVILALPKGDRDLAVPNINV